MARAALARVIPRKDGQSLQSSLDGPVARIVRYGYSQIQTGVWAAPLGPAMWERWQEGILAILSNRITSFLPPFNARAVPDTRLDKSGQICVAFHSASVKRPYYRQVS